MSGSSDPRPRLAAGLAAFALGDTTGALSWVRECRGARMDWGGIYTQGVRLTGPWSVRIARPVPLPAAPPASVSTSEAPGSFRTSRTDAELRVVEEVAVDPELPRVVVERRFSRVDGRADEIPVESSFTPFLAPVLLEGIRPHEFTIERRGTTLRLDAGGSYAAIEGSPSASAVRLDGEAWFGARRRGPIGTLALRHHVAIPADGEGVQRIVLVGGLRSGDAPPSGLAEAGLWAARSAATVARWEARTPVFESVDAPDLMTGYALARRALRSLYTRPQNGFTGLLAGYPWYAALWCRDLARMLPAVLWMGDADWAAASLDTVFRFQAPHAFPLLGAEAGELPMQVSPGPIFLYGTSDTTLYYPALVRRYLRHTGAVDRVRGWLKNLEAVRGWGEAKLDPVRGLLRNGGEIGEMRAASADAGRVHIGIDAPDTTIWDSADRRDHANDVELLWLEVLRALGELADLPGAPSAWAEQSARAAEFAGRLATLYRWDSEGYLYDSLRIDGTPVGRVRPNALQWVGAGILARDAERAIVARAAREDLAAPWGLRTLARSDPDFDPYAYHMGEVWPIASAWMARAAFAVGDAERGVEWLLRSARQIAAEGGFANECYRGDVAEPFDSCFLLGFSIAPFLSAFFEGLWGLEPDARAGVLGVAPCAPAAWSGMALRGLSFAGGTVDLKLDGRSLSARWSGPGPLVLAGPTRSERLAPGASTRLDLGPPQSS